SSTPLTTRSTIERRGTSTCGLWGSSRPLSGSADAGSRSRNGTARPLEAVRTAASALQSRPTRLARGRFSSIGAEARAIRVQSAHIGPVNEDDNCHPTHLTFRTNEHAIAPDKLW